MKKTRATNTFDKGLIMDLNPIATPNNVLTDCLNGTLITFNGNENVLQNDMGNGRVESAYLPEGYVPLGTAEFGGIIYIVSYNPLSNKCQIGSFPSPERNLSSDDKELCTSIISQTDFVDDEKVITQTSKTIELYDNSLNPGDKYIVYCSNNAIPCNANTLSGIFTDAKKSNPKIDDNIRYLTIHLVSVGDDGSITYLDDNTTWYNYTGTDDEGKENTYNYYIKNVKDESKMSEDVDANRDITTSTYNVFQSKTSGKLSLLFKLEVIDTFSASYDINPTGKIVDELVEANIVFNTNWTSRNSRINPKWVQFLTSSREAKSTKPEKGESKEILLTEERKNDGSDVGVDVIFDNLQYPSKPTESDIWNFSIIPVMEFGKMEYLPISYHIDLSKIGSGEITLDQWKYYINKNKSGEGESVLLKWGMSAYLEKNKTISDVTFSFVPFNKIPDKNSEIKWEEYPTYFNNTEKSYSGNFSLKIQFDNDYKITNGFLEKDSLYLVRIAVNYTDDPRYFYRWVYTTGLFNEKFLDNELDDFDSIYLNELLNPKFEIITKDTIEPTIYTKNPGLITDTNENSDDYTYMGLQTTTVGYSEGKYSKNDCIEVIINPTFNNSFFDIDSNLEYTIGDSTNSITHSDFIINSDKTSKISEAILSEVSTEGVSVETIQEAISGSTVTKEQSKNYKDSFTTEKTDLNVNKFSVRFRGAMFTRINADLAKKTIKVDQLMRPILSYTTDYADLGINELGDDLQQYFKECHWDPDGGQPVHFYFSRNSSYKCDLESEKQSFSTNKDYWNQGDSYSALIYWDGKTKPYDEYLNTWMLNYSGPFQLIRHTKSTDKSKANEQLRVIRYGQKSVDIIESFILWVKTSGDHYFPINSKISTLNVSDDDLKKNLENMVHAFKLFLMQIYYVDTEPSNIQKYIVDNVNYLDAYTETWRSEIEVTITAQDMDEHIIINNSNLTLKNLQEKNIHANICNIAYTEHKYDSNIPDYETQESISISHAFKVNSNILYEIYNDNKVTLIPALYKLSTKENDIISNVSFTPSYLYLYVNGSFIPLKNNPDYKIYTAGTINSVTQGDKVRLVLEPENNLEQVELLKYVNTTGNKVCFNETNLLNRNYLELDYLTKSDGGAYFSKGASFTPFIYGDTLWK